MTDDFDRSFNIYGVLLRSLTSPFSMSFLSFVPLSAPLLYHMYVPFLLLERGVCAWLVS